MRKGTNTRSSSHLNQSEDSERASLSCSFSLTSLFHWDVSCLVNDFESTNEPIEKRSTAIDTKKRFFSLVSSELNWLSSHQQSSIDFDNRDMNSTIGLLNTWIIIIWTNANIHRFIDSGKRILRSINNDYNWRYWAKRERSNDKQVSSFSSLRV